MLYFLLPIAISLSIVTLSVKSSPITRIDIIGGTVVDIRNYNYQVALLKNNKLLCGGSILTKKYALSAVHCVKREQTIPLIIRAGSSFWAKDGSLHQVDYISIYGEKMNTDVSVLRVMEPFVFDDTRQPIPLFKSGEVAEAGVMAVVTGWGLVNSTTISDQLQAVEVPIVDRQTCNSCYKGTLIHEIVDGEICAGYLGRGGKDSCLGDSGGPLVIKDRQAGIVSMGNGCAEPKYPGVYADVAYFHDWIIRQIST